MGFYGQRVSIVEPGWVSGDYGGRTETWDPAQGASETPVAFGVDVQPRMATEVLEDGTRVSKMLGYAVHTPPGRDLQVDRVAAVEWRGELYNVVGTRRWPSGDYPSGVDHVVLELERREG